MGRSIKVLQDQDIKGFTLLELLVVVALVSIITAIGIPNFNEWKKEREVRVAAEKIAGVLSGVNAAFNGAVEENPLEKNIPLP